MRSSSVLPTPPSDLEKYSYTRSYARPIAVVTILSTVGIAVCVGKFLGLAGLSPFALPVALWIPLFLTASTLNVWLQLTGRPFDLAAHRELVISWSRSWDGYPSVDVHLPVCGEPLIVLRNTWERVSRLEYPGTVEVYVLDDGASEDVHLLAQEFGFTYLCRPDRGWFKKAGNMRYGFARSEGEFIALFDADFAPRSDFLLETLPYFDEDPKLGILQLPQFFQTVDEQSWLERGVCPDQEHFYRLTQPGRDRKRASICNGSCAVYRRAALVEVGGTALVERSEDIHTGFDVRARGWNLTYIPVALATGLNPASLRALFSQRYRWCCGTVYLIASRKFWGTPMTVAARLCYLMAFVYYAESALAVVAVPMMPIWMLWFRPEWVGLNNYLFLVPAMLMGWIIKPHWSRSSWRPEVLTVRLAVGWVHIITIVDAVRRRPEGWKPSGGAMRPSRRFDAFRGCVLAWGGSTALLWLALTFQHGGRDGHPIDFIPPLWGGLFYLWSVTRLARASLTQAARTTRTAAAAEAPSEIEQAA